MTRASTHSPPPGQVLVPASAIGGLAILLAAGLQALHVLDRANAAVARAVSPGPAVDFPNQLPGWVIWLATAIFALGTAFALLGTAGQWRRVMLCTSAAVLVAAWAPVLALAAYAPEVAAPWIATLWSGVCALVYASKHLMAADDPR